MSGLILKNCSHRPVGWCLACVQRQYNAMSKIIDDREKERHEAVQDADAAKLRNIEYCKQLAALRAENQKLREERRWIPASERLPESRTFVLGFFPDGDALDGKRVTHIYYSMAGQFAQRRAGDPVPTHWQPLPPAPDTATGAAKGVEGD